MPSLSVRKIEVETLSLLRSQATRHGVSMEEEVRQIIKRSVTTPERLFSPAYGKHEEIEIEPRQTHEPISF